MGRGKGVGIVNLTFDMNSIEKIFAECGRYDATVSFVFKKNSESYNQFGESLTGVLYYSKQERESLTELIKQQVLPNNSGNIKIKVLLTKELTKEQLRYLHYNGFNSEDIDYYDYYIRNWQVPFESSEVRELPEKNIIYQKSSGFVNDSKFRFGFYQQRLTNGESLIPFEVVEYAALGLFFDCEVEERIIFDDGGNVRDDVRFEYLILRFYSDRLTKEEEDEFAQALQNRTLEMRERVEQQFRNSGLSKVEIYSDHLRLMYELIVRAIYFRPKLLSFTKPPVYWDLDSALHIYFRHTDKLRVGKNYKEKSTFQYRFNEIEELIENCLNELHEEINQHFERRPNVPFDKYGSQAHYHNGDYYELKIAPNGRLETFYELNR